MTKLKKIRKVLFVQKPQLLEQQIPEVTEILGKNLVDLDLSFASSPHEVEQGSKFDAIITPTVPWLPKLLSCIDCYHWIHFLSAGIDKIWEMEFDKETSLLTKSSGVHGPPMSEYAIGAMLYFAKQFGRFKEQGDNRLWQRMWLDELTRKKLAILGLGSVGQAIAIRAKSFDMEVWGISRHLRPVSHVDKVMSMHDLRDNVSQVDYLVICLPLTHDTRNLIDE